jgi:hypothetical protein
MAHATVSRCLQRRGMSRRPPAPKEAVRRFEWPCPGDLLQMDTKRLARFTRPGHAVTGDRYRSAQEKRNGPGWEFCHSIIDDHSRLAYTEIHPDEQAPTVTGFVERALEFFAAHGITARRQQSDNAFTYIHNRTLRELLTSRGIQHRRIPPRMTCSPVVLTGQAAGIRWVCPPSFDVAATSSGVRWSSRECGRWW